MIMTKQIAIFIMGFILFSSCCQQDCARSENEENADLYGASDYLISATLWYQNAAELRALYYQAYNVAKQALIQNLANHNGEKTPAIVFDLDETVLDNSFYEADLIFSQTSYTTESWKEWTDMESAKALPGALEFVEFAMSTGVEIFYVSNRRTNELESTYQNISKLGFPEVPIENYIFRDAESSKIERRSKISENYEIILLLGDNLNDFAGDFEDRAANNGFEAVDANKDMFGTKYIVFPNPMYGAWQGPLNTDEDLSPHQNRLNALVGSADVCK
jgi:5'-nucleotidase (lipoprotein e(P4) family)